MRPAVCGRGGNLNCWGADPIVAGGRKTARRKTRCGGARRSRRRGVRGGRQSNNMPPHIMGIRGGGNTFLPAVCEDGWNDC